MAESQPDAETKLSCPAALQDLHPTDPLLIAQQSAPSARACSSETSESHWERLQAIKTLGKIAGGKAGLTPDTF